MRERLTYRFLTQLIGAIVAFLIVVIKVVKVPITINGTTLEPDDLGSLILAAGGVLAVIIPIFIPDEHTQKPILSGKDSPLPETTLKDNRQTMLGKVRSIWIQGYLEPILNEMAALRLNVKFVEPEKVMQRIGIDGEDLPDSGAILKTFNQLGRRLVILGEPGAGKTVTLLQLCRELLDEAKNDERKPIPVVLALSSWAAERHSFEDWLRTEVREKYGMSQKVADDLVEREQLLYLLDGLDEVAESQRDTCLKTIKTFVETERKDTRYVLSCRYKEYNELPMTSRLNVLGALTLQPLDDVQIGAYLSGDDFQGLTPIWSQSAILRDLGRVPFMLNTIAVVTCRKAEPEIRAEIDLSGDADQVRSELLHAYISRRMKEADAKRRSKYSDRRITRERLQWLARQLIKHDETDFYIESLQEDWLGSEANILLNDWTVRTVIGLLVGLAFGATMALIAAPGEVVLVTVGVGLLIGLLVGLPKIEVADELYWQPDISYVLVGLVIGLIAGLVGVALGVSLGLALLGGAVGGVIGGLALGFGSREQIEYRVQPNGGMQQSLVSAVKIWLVSSASVGVAVGVAYGLRYGWAFHIAFGLAVGLAGGLRYGATTVIQHMVLRLYLAREGHIPYGRYDTFLDYCANDLIILRKVGGGYRFVHDYMRQYLAGAASAPEAATPKD